jgi:hypothetical protein
MMPFVSGLPSRSSTPVADPAGCRLLHGIRELALNEAAALEPACRPRFNGSERISADPVAIDRCRIHYAIIGLIDAILADAELARRLADVVCKQSDKV